MLPKQKDGNEHHDALPYVEMPEFMSQLRAVDGVANRALELLCLTAMRTAEVRLAKWSEFDLDSATWTVPAARMKKSTADHRVPLSERAVNILRALPRLDDWVFPGAAAGKPIGSSTMLREALKPLRADCTVHGFRSTFRDWAAETTGYPNHVVEMALAHTVGTAVEKAYRRGDLLEKRKRLMQDWSSYCCGPAKAKAGQVVPLRRAE